MKYKVITNNCEIILFDGFDEINLFHYDQLNEKLYVNRKIKYLGLDKIRVFLGKAEPTPFIGGEMYSVNFLNSDNGKKITINGKKVTVK